MEVKTLQDERKRLGLSQTKLSMKAGVSRNRISQFECGYLKLTDAEILAIEESLKLESLSDTKTGRANAKS